MSCRRIIGLLVMASMGFANGATAALWELTGTLGQQVKYDDNISLNPARKQSVVGYLLTPSLQASYKTGSLEMGLSGQGDIRRFDDPRWDCNNYNVGFNNRYLTRRSVFALSGGYGLSCSYAQQILDTGILTPNSQSESYNLKPSWTWQWTPRDQLIALTSYSKTSYTNTSSGLVSGSGVSSIGFSGNETYSANLGVNHAWSRRISLDGGLFFSNVQYTGTNASTQNIFGFQLGGKYLVSSKWTVNLGGGPRWMDSQLQSNSTSSAQNPSLILGYTVNLGVSYKDRLSVFSTGYSSAVNPSALGQTLQTQSIFASYSYQFAHNLSLDLNSNLSNSQSIGGQSQSAGNPTTAFSRDYFTASTALAWNFARDWKLIGSYIYRWQQYKQQANPTSDSNAVMLSLNYAWDGVRDSR